jgi:hypothetical protein
MYNINIELTYHIVNNEIFRLYDKYKGYKPPSELEYFCDKLYCNELLQVFHSNEILDDNMIREFKKLLVKMNENMRFKKLNGEIITCITQLYGNIITTQHDINYEMFTILFGKQVFYIFHKCIEQQYETGNIEDSMFNQLTVAVLTCISIDDE